MAGRYDRLLEEWPTDIPFERVVRARLGALDDLVGQGVTWAAIAAALARAGVTKKNGRPLSGRHVNAVYLRNKTEPNKVQPVAVRLLDPAPMTDDSSFRPRISIAAGLHPPVPTTQRLEDHMPTDRPVAGGLAERLREARHFNKIEPTEYEE